MTVTPLGMPLPVVSDGDDATLVAAERWLTRWLPVLGARRNLLAEWIKEASGDTSQLYPELLRYADVLASTCTGAGSRPELADLDFDLAIVDEAGQIGVADALIPLVRARRAILVVDHMQLPPFLDSEVDVWGKHATDPIVQNMLKKSALEIVVEALPPASPNVVWLTEQRRMPEVIATFASQQFYQGRLETPAGLRQHRGGLSGPRSRSWTPRPCPGRSAVTGRGRTGSAGSSAVTTTRGRRGSSPTWPSITTMRTRTGASSCPTWRRRN